MENKNEIIDKIKATAYEKVNDKLKKEQEETERKIQQDLEKVNACLELIENQMVFKIIKKDYFPERYVIATEEMFFEDYSKETNCWTKGIVFSEKYRKKWQCVFSVNGEKYFDINYMMQDYMKDLDDFAEQCKRLNEDVAKKMEQKQHLIEISKEIAKLLKSVEVFNTDEILNKYLTENEEW